MSPHLLQAIDLIAICILVFGLFLPRHRRPDLVVAFLTVNVGVMAVATALASSTIGAGLGLGLFGVLSIIRLRSEELAQSEIAYYFAALTLGLLAGLNQSPGLREVGLMAAVVIAVGIGDLLVPGRGTSSQELLLDRAITDQDTLVDHLAGLLGAEVLAVKVRRVDLVNDTTLVLVRHREAHVPAREVLR
ncbi:DUF4956 domain-containing protein [Nocardioides sp. AE5]|uniref:DUF4956 domain-containing protein n=1 Tax=Nocardioides sp. AE5 TaxID=2962573 RepID=UPI002880EFD6|nr:DUF4956 domain-containing protein [Nocardioides sp. AE5]MDT0200924.1 DUF4956 domain-containing protein [Nocardioides sp. AE5]